MPLALTRDISPAIARCELTHLARVPIDIELARRQHVEYEEALGRAGCRVERLAADPQMPDSVFIEDTALVFDEVAIVTRPGAPSRQPEVQAVAEALGRYRPLRRIVAPATVDGGDVLVIDRTVFVGRSRRTNDAAIEQIREALAPFAYEVRAVDVRGCLHLKSAATRIGERDVLANRSWLPPDVFAGFDVLDVDEQEPSAANVLTVGDHVICSSSFPRTLERLRRRGLSPTLVDTSELAKAEGALTCCSLILADAAKGF